MSAKAGIQSSPRAPWFGDPAITDNCVITGSSAFGMMTSEEDYFFSPYTALGSNVRSPSRNSSVTAPLFPSGTAR